MACVSCHKAELDNKFGIGVWKMKTRTILYADDGKVLTDGKEYGTQIFLEEGRSADEFHEISSEKYEEILDEAALVNASL